MTGKGKKKQKNGKKEEQEEKERKERNGRIAPSCAPISMDAGCLTQDGGIGVRISDLNAARLPNRIVRDANS